VQEAAKYRPRLSTSDEALAAFVDVARAKQAAMSPFEQRRVELDDATANLPGAPIVNANWGQSHRPFASSAGATPRAP
jgi:hypothetical protein